MSFKIDATDPNNLSNKVLSERETRRRILAQAKILKRDKEIQMLFDHVDNLLKRCDNIIEREAIAAEGARAVHIILGGGGQLYVQNKLVANDEK